MSKRSQSFDVRNKSYSDIQNIIENILRKNLSLSIKTKKLGNYLLRISYFDNDTDQDQQKDNRITILQDPEKRVYIQINGNLTDTQVRQIWRDFEKNSNISMFMGKIDKTKPSKENVIQNIKQSINLKGYLVTNEDIRTFLENFIEKFNRLPEESEYHSIVQGYIVMMNERYLKEKAGTSIKSESSSESLESVLDIIDDNLSSGSYKTNVVVLEDPVIRRKCPSCGDEGAIHEIPDKNIILMHSPRIYGKKKYCGKCGFEWK
ncbi:MAG: hypothetical protein ACFFCL_16335 [Promethearchaeota archaeon]